MGCGLGRTGKGQAERREPKPTVFGQLDAITTVLETNPASAAEIPAFSLVIEVGLDTHSFRAGRPLVSTGTASTGRP
jgi:hypothetical protein